MKNSCRSALISSITAVLALSGFFAQAAALPRLRVSENGRFFVKADGSPFFYLGDTEWGLFHLSREDAELYLKDRAAKKFTVIQAVVTFWGGLDRPNAYGETVFVGGDPTRPNEAYFRHVDYVVDKAESLGLYIGMVPIWSKEYVQQDRSMLENPSFGTSIRSAIRAEKPSVVDKSSAYTYGRFLGRRYRDKPIIWILGGDWFASGTEEIWRAMAAGIAEGDGGTHLKTYHPKSPRSSSQWFHNDAWLDFNMLQTGHTSLNRNYDLVAADYDRIPVKPVVDGEGGYEGIADAMAPPNKIEPSRRPPHRLLRRFRRGRRVHIRGQRTVWRGQSRHRQGPTGRQRRGGGRRRGRHPGRRRAGQGSGDAMEGSAANTRWRTDAVPAGFDRVAPDAAADSGSMAARQRPHGHHGPDTGMPGIGRELCVHLHRFRH